METYDIERRFELNPDQYHVGSLHELCVEKGSELLPTDPGRTYKGRVVFLGDRVKDGTGKGGSV